jgi:hypothetical protein
VQYLTLARLEGAYFLAFTGQGWALTASLQRNIARGRAGDPRATLLKAIVRALKAGGFERVARGSAAAAAAAASELVVRVPPRLHPLVDAAFAAPPPPPHPSDTPGHTRGGGGRDDGDSNGGDGRGDCASAGDPPLLHTRVGAEAETEAEAEAEAVVEAEEERRRQSYGTGAALAVAAPAFGQEAEAEARHAVEEALQAGVKRHERDLGGIYLSFPPVKAQKAQAIHGLGLAPATAVQESGE